MLDRRPDLLASLRTFYHPVKDDADTRLLQTLHGQGLLAEDLRRGFVEAAIVALVESADSSLFDEPSLRDILSDEEFKHVTERARLDVLPNIPKYIESLAGEWSTDYPPEDYYWEFEKSIRAISAAVDVADDQPLANLQREVRIAVASLECRYEPSSSTSAPVGTSTPRESTLVSLFRDVDE